MTPSFVLGIDLGTTGVKALLVPVSAEPPERTATETTVEYPLSVPHPGWSEQNPEDWWSATGEAIRGLLGVSRVASHQVAAMALSGQMHGATMLDASGAVLRPCILWNDQRSAAQCAEITERVGLERLMQWVGNPALAGFTAPKILWVREHEPDVFRRTATVLLPKDYVNYRLTGVQATEFSDASGTILFDVVQRRWSQEMLDALELPASLLPDAIASTDVMGYVAPQAAAHTGLLAGTPVIAGGADNACAAVGSGVTTPGTALVSLGTSGTVVAPVAPPRADPRARLHLFCHAVPGMWYQMGVVLAAGASLRWFRDSLAGEERRQAETEGMDPYDLIMAEAAEVPPGSERLIFLPYLTGERSPHGDPAARGCFVGLTPVHTRAHMARSVIEGVSFALADSVQIMREMGLQISAVRATGGGARSALWRTILAAVLNARVLLAAAGAGPALGAATLAGIGAGAFPSFEEARARLVTIRDQIDPPLEDIERYVAYRQIYDGLYPALRDSFRGLSLLDT